MYTISVPIMNRNVKRSNREKLLSEIKKFDAKRVIISLESYETDDLMREESFRELKENCAFFKNHGYEVGTWIWTFWIKNNTKGFHNMRSIKGTEITEFMCPTDENFVAFATQYVSDIARCGVDIIQFDDDFRYGFLSDSPACLCDRHIEMINGITGENTSREDLEKYIITGKKNKFRDAYLKANGNAFREFAAALRKSIDNVNPDIRVGFCACLSGWDIDGTDPFELATILAGNTKPLIRLIGAPYWAVNRNWGNCLQDVVELERMESAWTRQGDVELMAEGDVYPRPRTHCPASYLEGFDTAIRVSGCTDGILKYGLDYTSNADYETGYALFHQRNRQVYSDIEQFFGGKTSCGVRVYESMKKISDMTLPTKVNCGGDIQDLFFSKAARTLSCNSIPTVYEGKGVCGIVFDENARNLPLSALENGLILDLAAAEILTERGIDVGLESIGESLCDGFEEHFLENDNHIATQSDKLFNIQVKHGVEVLSDINTAAGRFPVSYRYENANGNRFLVLNINTRDGRPYTLNHYARGLQFAQNIPWLSGNKLPAYVYGHPSLYIQCKKSGDSMSVGLWNFFADTAINPIVELDLPYKIIKFLNCTGKLDKNKVILNEINPFAFVGFEVSL